MQGGVGYRWGRWVAAHAGRVLLVWLVLLAAAGPLTAVFLSRLSGSEFVVSGSGSAHAQQLIRNAFRDAPEERDLVVFHSNRSVATDSAFRAAVKASLQRAAQQPLVISTVSPYSAAGQLISGDKHTALAVLSLRGSQRDRQSAVPNLQSAVSAGAASAIDVYLTGTSPINAALISQENHDLRLAEGVGVPIAAVVLLIAFGTVVAAVIPLAIGLAGVLLSFGVLGAASFVTSWNVFVESTLAMIGIALGIDYSLFLVTRFREERAQGADLPEAVGRMMNSAGKAVAFSGITVLISLSGLLLVNASFYRQMGFGVILAAFSMLLASLTLLPAVVALLGDRINRLTLPALRRRVQKPDPEHGVWGRFARLVMRRPLVFLVVAGMAMLALASPVRKLSLGFDLGTSAVRGTDAGKGFELASKTLAPGIVSPIQIVVHDSQGQLSHDFVDRVAKRVTSVEGVLGPASAPQFNKAANTALLTIAARHAPDDTRTIAAVRHIRDRMPRLTDGTPDQVYVGGLSARIRDLESVTTSTMPLIFGVVLAASFILLLLAFRSILLPIKALVMNLLSVAAAYGAVILVFQEGHLSSLLGFTSTGYLQVYLPLLTFAVLFGLSMDYEVFLVSRIREEWQRTGDNRRAVAVGIAHTARVITAAATIMVCVFAAFLLAGVSELQQMGFALALAVLLDASVVRLLLIPSLMRLFGRANWWLPRFLDRRLPDLQIDESPGSEREPVLSGQHSGGK